MGSGRSAAATPAVPGLLLPHQLCPQRAGLLTRALALAALHCSVWGTLEEQVAADLRRYSYQELSTALAQRGIIRKRGRKEDLVNLLTELVVQVSLPLGCGASRRQAGMPPVCCGYG